MSPVHLPGHRIRTSRRPDISPLISPSRRWTGRASTRHADGPRATRVADPVTRRHPGMIELLRARRCVAVQHTRVREAPKGALDAYRRRSGNRRPRHLWPWSPGRAPWCDRTRWRRDESKGVMLHRIVRDATSRARSFAMTASTGNIVPGLWSPAVVAGTCPPDLSAPGRGAQWRRCLPSTAGPPLSADRAMAAVQLLYGCARDASWVNVTVQIESL